MRVGAWREGPGVAAFTHVATVTAGPATLLTGLTDLEIRWSGGSATLYSATRPGGGLSAFRLTPGGGLDPLDQEAFSPGVGANDLELLLLGGTAYAVPLGQAGPALPAYALTGNGSFGASALVDGAAGPISTLLKIGARLYTAGPDGGGLQTYRITDGETLTALPPRGHGPTQEDVSALARAETADQTFLLAASTSSDDVTSHRIGSKGVAIPVARFGAKDGLGIDDPTAFTTAQVGQTTYAIVGSAGTGSLSVLRLWADGSLSAVDHILDSQDTRFQGLTTLTSVTVEGRSYVIAGGSDDGLSLFVLLPGGQLLHLASLADTAAMTLANVSALAATADGTQLRIFVASEAELGFTELSVDLGPLAPMQRGAAAAEILTGGSAGDLLAGRGGDDRLRGKGGDDLLIDGPGADRLRGGAGADIFVLAPDSHRDRIDDFTPGTDRLDLSGYPMVYSLDAVSWKARSFGGILKIAGDALEIRSASDGPLNLHAVLPQGLIGPTRPPLVLADPNLRIDGTRGPDTFRGAGGRDRIDGKGGADQIEGRAGNDRLWGADGADEIHAGPGDDRVWSGVGDDVVTLGNGDDVYRDAKATGRSANDTATGGPGADRLIGYGGADRLLGGADNDRIDGGGGGDRLFGGAGRDTISGGAGDDRLTGGGGADTFVFGPSMGHDRITDYAKGGDSLTFDARLWEGEDLGPGRVVRRYAEVDDGNTVFDFGEGHRLILLGVRRLDGLAEDIDIV